MMLLSIRICWKKCITLSWLTLTLSLQVRILSAWIGIVTTADSMIQNNGKCFIHLKLDLLNERNEREALYTELSLEQFYAFYHELKRAHSLMEVVSWILI